MDVLERVAFAIWYTDWCNDMEQAAGSHFEYLSHKWQTSFLPYRNADHAGDCTNIPISCRRCEMDHYFAVAQKILSGN